MSSSVGGTLAFALLLMGSVARADLPTSPKLSACTTTPDLTVNSGPPYNQKNTNLCHTLTATDQLTKKLQDLKVLGPGERIHPLHVAAARAWWVNNSSPNQMLQRIGTPVTNFESIVKYGKLCTVKDLGGDAIFRNPLFQKATDTQASAFMMAALDLPSVRGDSASRACTHADSIRALESEMPAIQRNLYASELNRRCSVACPRLDWHWRWQKNWDEEIKQTPVPRDPEKIEALGADIDQALASGSLPGIGYSPSFALSVPFDGVHWSSIAQRIRGDDGKCYYRLRNSWGPRCKMYREPQKCSHGYILVEREALLQHAVAVQYLK